MDPQQTETTQTETPMLTLKTYEYKRNIPVYKASIVDLTLVSLNSLGNIDKSTKFGEEFYKLAGNQIQTFLDTICEMYEKCNITDSHSSDYRTCWNFFFLESKIKRRVKYAELRLDNAMHKLNLLLSVLIIQLRTKMELFQKSHISSDYTKMLMGELEQLLNTLPAQEQKEIVITDKREYNEEDNTLPIKTITITYEPFIEHVNASFNEASKLKRLQSNEPKTEKPKRTITVVDMTKPSHHNKPKKEKKPKTITDEDGWITKNKK